MVKNYAQCIDANKKIPTKCVKNYVIFLKARKRGKISLSDEEGRKKKEIFAVYSNVKIPFCLMMQTYTPSLFIYAQQIQNVIEFLGFFF